MGTSRRALGIAAVVSVFLLTVAGSVLSVRAEAGTGSTRTTAHQIVADHDAVVSVRPAADRSPFDLRQIDSKLLLLAWIGVLLVAALRVRTAGRTMDVRTRRSGSVAWVRHVSVRGPPAPSFA